jgi:hypothetical protein
MELVWAAYYNQGIDIDCTEWNLDPPYYLYPWVYGNDILKDDDIEMIYREVNDSVEIIKPMQGLYIDNKKIITMYKQILVFGNVDIQVSMINPDRIQRVNFYVNENKVAYDSTKPFNWTYKERSFGKKIIKVEAIDFEESCFYANTTLYKFF